MNDQKTNPDADQLFHANRAWAKHYSECLVKRHARPQSTMAWVSAKEEAVAAGEYGLLMAARSFNGTGRFEGWASIHVRGQVIDWFRAKPFFGRRHASARVESLNHDSENLNSKFDTFGHERAFEKDFRDRKPKPEISREDARAIIRAETEGMPRDQQLALILRFGERLHISEIAKAIGVGESRLCQIYDMAIRTMRDRRPGAFPTANTRARTIKKKERQLALYGRHYDNAVIRQNELREMNRQGVAA